MAGRYDTGLLGEVSTSGAASGRQVEYLRAQQILLGIFVMATDFWLLI